MALRNALKKNRSAKSGGVATKASKPGCKWCAIGECWGCSATRGKVQGVRQTVGKGKGKGKGKMMWVPVPRIAQLKGVLRQVGKQQKGSVKKESGRPQVGKQQKSNVKKEMGRSHVKNGMGKNGMGRTQRGSSLQLAPRKAAHEKTRGKVQGGRPVAVRGKGKEKGRMMWVPASRFAQRNVLRKVGKQQKGSVKKEGGRPKKENGRLQRGGSQRSRKAAPGKRIWLAGLPVIEDREERTEAGTELQEQFNNTLDCKHVEIWRNGHGYAIFGSEQDVQVALETFAGSNFRGNVIEVDVWEKTSK